MNRQTEGRQGMGQPDPGDTVRVGRGRREKAGPDAEEGVLTLGEALAPPSPGWT